MSNVFPPDIEAAQARLVELQTDSQDLQTTLNLRVIEDDEGNPLTGHPYNEARRKLVDEWNEVNAELRGLKLHVRGLRHASRARPEGTPNPIALVDRLVAVHAAGGDTEPLLDELAGVWNPR